MERRRFESEWKEAFQHAERSPSDSVWTNIELDLERASGGKMKRRLLFFQLLAAASMVFAMGVGGVYYLQSGQQTSTSNLANNDLKDHPTESVLDSSTSENTTDKTDFDRLKNQASAETSQLNPVRKSFADADTNRKGKAAKNIDSSELLVAKDEDQNNLSSRTDIQFRDREFRGLSIKQPVLHFKDKPVEDPGQALLAKLDLQEKAFRDEDSKSSRREREKLWTSVGFGAGTYNPNASSPSTNSSISGSSLVSNSTPSNPTSGSAYSVGVTVGGRIANHIVVQGGLLYLNQNAEFTSSAVTGSNKVALNEFSLNSERVNATTPYDVTSNLQYVSLPVQAGYYVLDHDFAIQLSGGVSTDFFIRNTLSTDNARVQDISSGPGKGSPFRSVNFSGLLGTEFSYRFSDHYRFAVNPGMRYALNSIYKSDVSASLSPVTIDVSVRFKYIF